MDNNREIHEKFMRRCLELAGKSAGFTYPNPMVGAVVVHNGRIIGEGFHLKAGTPHAEVIAIASVKERHLLDESTIYVNLEPCSHYGRTPPCADLIIESGIPNVVVGTVDSNSKVSGSGISRLCEAGCQVEVGILGEECRILNRRFFTYHEKKRPYIILKWAESSDGFIDIDASAKDNRGTYWISGITERILVHRWRATEQAILAGGRTIRVDNPGLNVRLWSGYDPVRLVLSDSGDIDAKSMVFNTGERSVHFGSRGQTVMFTRGDVEDFKGCDIVSLKKDIESAQQIVDYLYNKEIQSLIVEGGASTLNHFISLGLWDEARIFTGKIPFHKGVKTPSVDGEVTSTHDFERCSLSVLKRMV